MGQKEGCEWSCISWAPPYSLALSELSELGFVQL
jgi:hypothetical protein